MPNDGAKREFFDGDGSDSSSDAVKFEFELGYRNANQKMDGPGIRLTSKSYAEGLWSDGNFVKGFKINCTNGELKQGSFENLKLQGHGVIVDKDCTSEGFFVNGHRHGLFINQNFRKFQYVFRNRDVAVGCLFTLDK